MKNGIKVVMGTSVLSLSLLAAAVPGFAFDANQKTSGGWSESRGYYTNLLSRVSLLGSAPEEHHGERLYRNINGSGDPVYEYAAYGYTVWKNTYHYTTAQMENTKGTVRTTSGRQWGTGGTTATSPYYAPELFENTEARTYWGNE